MILADGDTFWHVAVVVSHGVLVPVVLAIGVEVSAGTLEVGCITGRILVDMHGMESKFEVFQFDFYFHALLHGLEGCRAGVLAGRAQNRNLYLLGSFLAASSRGCHSR